MRRKSIMIGTLVIVAASACGGSRPSHPSSPSSPPSSRSTGASLTNAGTIVLLDCGVVDELSDFIPAGSTGLTQVTTAALRGVSVDSGATTQTVLLHPPQSAAIPALLTTGDGDGSDPCSTVDPTSAKWDDMTGDLRDQFDKGFANVAALDTNPKASPSLGVTGIAGEMNVKTGKVTDLVPASSSGFGDAEVDASPQFSPATGALWYVSTQKNDTADTVMSVDPSTKATTSHPSPGSLQSYEFQLSTGGVAVTDEGDLRNEHALPDPSGSVGVANTGDCTLGLSRFGSAGQKCALYDSQDGAGQPTLPGAKARDYYSSWPIAWIGARTVLLGLYATDPTQGGVGSEFVTVTFSADFSSVTSVSAPLLPESDRKNGLAVASPDGKSIAFVSEEGSTYGLYSLSLVPGSTPRKIADLGGHLQIPLAWE